MLQKITSIFDLTDAILAHHPVCAPNEGIEYRIKPILTARLSPTNSLMPMNRCSFPQVFNVAARCGKYDSFQHHSW
jgi:hypothetical protein